MLTKHTLNCIKLRCCLYILYCDAFSGYIMILHSYNHILPFFFIGPKAHSVLLVDGERSIVIYYKKQDLKEEIG